MTLPEVNDQLTYYREHPPLHLMVANYLGVETKSSAAPAGGSRRLTSEDELRALLASNGGH